jgi:glycosyltransferase involved in cell wall biosynthesis
MAAPLNILQVTPALETGGVERTTIEIAEAVAAAGGQALVASAGGRLEAELAQVGGVLERMPLNTKNPSVILANVDRLTHLVRARGVGLIHARSRAPAWSALWAARRTGLPFVTTYHGIYSASGPVKRFYNSVMARGDRVIANSDFTRAHILKEYKIDPARVISIPRSVDLDVFDPGAVSPERTRAMRASWAVPVDRLIALVPARLSRWKGQDLLIEAAALVEKYAPGRVAYVLAGDAQGREDYVAALDAAIAKAGLTELIIRVGHVSDMPAAFAASDFAIFPPTGVEAFGRGAIEAQAMGAPVIAADNGGFTETVMREESGLLFPSGDAGALATAIVRLSALPADIRAQMGQKGQARVRALYSKQALQRSTLDIYATLLHTKAS